MAAADGVLLEVDGHVATITLNRPDRLNAINVSVMERLEEAWRRIADDPEIRAVVVTGAGRGFCAGGDADVLEEAAGDEEARTRDYPRFTARMLPLYRPVITAVNGVCAGAGLHFVADSDIVICSEGATFVDTHVNVGHVSALEPIGLRLRIPLERLLRMVVLGKEERIDAATAREIGLVSEVVPEDALLARAHELATIAAAGSPATMEASLRAIWQAYEHPLREAYRNGWSILREHRHHPDAIEGPRAFIDKRPPVWTVR